jgi:hypothetical protein
MKLTGKITRELIDRFIPEHSRTFCSDDNLCNKFEGLTGKYDVNIGEKIIYYPRCNRCYLLDYIGENFEELEFNVEIETLLTYNRKEVQK